MNNTLVKLNNEMMKCIISTNSYDAEKITQKVDEFSRKVFSTIKLIDDCIVVLDFHNRRENGKLNYDKIVSLHGDYTGYEAFCNEMRISDYIDVNGFETVPFILRLIENLKSVLMKMYPQFHFVLIGIINAKETEIRFHMLRKNELGWLSENIDEYKEATIVNIV